MPSLPSTRAFSSRSNSLLSNSKSLVPASTNARPREYSDALSESAGQSRMRTSVVSLAARTLCLSTGSYCKEFGQQRVIGFDENTEAWSLNFFCNAGNDFALDGFSSLIAKQHRLQTANPCPNSLKASPPAFRSSNCPWPAS